MIVPVLAIAGALAGKKTSPPGPGTLPTERAAVRRPPGRRHPHRRRPDVLPGAEPGPDRRALPRAVRKGLLSHEQRYGHEPSRPGTGALLRRRARRTACASSTRGSCAKNPVMFVVEVGSVLTTVIWLRDLLAPPRRRSARLVHRPAWRSGCGSRCSSRTSRRRWPRAAARRRPPPCAACARRRSARQLVDGNEERVSASDAAQGRPGGGGGGRGDPGRRRGRSRASPRWTSRPSPASRRR